MNYTNIKFLLINVLFIEFVLSYSSSSEYSSVIFRGNCSECNNFSVSKINEKCKEDKKLQHEKNEEIKNDYQIISNSDKKIIKIDKIPWYLSVPSLPVLFATSSTFPEGECKRQVQKYLKELNNGTLWAVRSKLYYFPSITIKQFFIPTNFF